MDKCNLCKIHKRGYYNYYKKGTKALIIDSFPNKMEIRTQMPSVMQGSKSRLWHHIINKTDWSPDDFSFATLTKCIPKNKDIDNKSTREYIKKCTKAHLINFIKEINPEIIIVQDIGGLYSFFHGGQIETQRGKLKYWNEYKVLPTYSIKTMDSNNTTKVRRVISDLTYAYNLTHKHNKQDLNLNMASNKKEFYKYLDIIKQYDRLGADIETTGRNPYKGDKVFGIGVAIDDYTAYYFPIRIHNIIGDGYSLRWDNKEMKALQNFFESDRKFTFHYSNFDIEFLQVQEKWNIYAAADSLVLSHLLDENKKEYSLEYLTNKNYMDLVGFKEESKDKLDHSKSFDKMPLEILAKRCCIDSIATYRLTNKYMKELKQNKKLYKYYKTFRKPLLNLFIRLQKTGYKIDYTQLNKVSKKYDKLLDSLKKKMWDIAGFRFNPNSTKDLRKVLYGTLKYKVPDGFRTEKTNQPKTDQPALKAIQEEQESPFINNLLEYKSVYKLKSNYVDGLRKYAIKGRVHSKFRIAVADTGRSSSQSPNAQNISGNEDIKSIITTSKGYKIIEADFSQAEARLFAYLCGSERLIKASTEKDIYTYMASKLYDKNYNEVDKELRDYCKVITLALLYGMGAASLGKMINKSKRKAQQLLDKFFKEFPKVKEWSNNIISDLKSNGEISSIFGRVRHLPSIFSPNNETKERAKRQAVNFKVQSPTFDIVSIGLRRAEKALKPFDARIILTVHDCVVVEANENQLNDIIPVIKKAMEKPVPPIPDGLMEVDVEVGDNWGYMEEYEF